MKNLTREHYENYQADLRTMFDIVRLVDPSSLKCLSFNDDGSVVETTEVCHDVWGNHFRCLNCISAKAITSGVRQTKIEFRDKDPYFVAAEPVKIDGRVYSMECVMEMKNLDPTVVGDERIHSDIRRMSEKIYLDSLTGAYNKRYFDEVASGLICSGTALIEVSGFDEICGAYGCAAGDRILADIARIVRNNIRGTDGLIRCAENTFLLYFYGLSDLRAFIRKLFRFQSEISKIQVPDAPDWNVSVNIGAAFSERTIGELFEETDRQLLLARDSRFHLSVWAEKEGSIELSDECAGSSGDDESVDEITGMMNIKLFRQEVLKIALDSSQSGKWDLVFFNIRRFSVYNRRQGFENGNVLLRKLSTVIRKAAGSDKVFRYYADNFYALIPDDRAEAAVKEIHDCMIDDAAGKIFVQAGIYQLGSGTDVERAFDRAKLACRKVEGNLNACFMRFRPEMEKLMIQDYYIYSHVDEAVKNGWIKVYFQPIVSTADMKLVALEALSRWDDPVYGFLSPEEFIPVLEEAGLLYKIDQYVFASVCDLLKKAQDEGRAIPDVSVNLSRRDLEIPGIHDEIRECVDRRGLPRGAVHFEITESSIIGNEALVSKHLDQFHQEGFTVWLDDFGSGLSSLNTLQNYDFDCIKIDMKFLSEKNEKTPILLKSIIDLAKRLDMLTLTEGVETKEDLSLLQDLGCTLSQGFYVSRPLPLDVLRPLLEKKHISARPHSEHSDWRSL